MGDTITLTEKPAREPLKGFKNIKPMVFCGLYPIDSNFYEQLKEALEKIIMDDARVYLNQGYIFGSEGEGFERINIACPRSILTEALERIETSVKAYLKQNPNT